MGSMQGQEFADAVARQEISLDAALEWHLTANHFPPIHRDFIPVAKKAIEAAVEEDWDLEILMPNGKRLSVSEIVEGLHLDPFVEAAMEEG